jgi:hypothetical protein
MALDKDMTTRMRTILFPAGAPDPGQAHVPPRID